MVNRLTFAPGNSPAHGIFYWEPLVDGAPLRKLLAYVDPDDHARDSAGLGPPGDNIPVFAHNWPVGLPDEVLMLLGALTSPLPNGRVPLFVCPVCGDLGCGAVSVGVERSTTTVVWRDFGWDFDYEIDGEPSDPILGGPFVFDRREYEAEMFRFVTTFDEVRAGVPPRPVPGAGRRTGRRFSLFGRRPT